MKNGKNFDWQAYDDRIAQQPGRGSLTITEPRDEDLGMFIFKIMIVIRLQFYLIKLFFYRTVSMFCRKRLGYSYF